MMWSYCYAHADWPGLDFGAQELGTATTETFHVSTMHTLEVDFGCDIVRVRLSGSTDFRWTDTRSNSEHPVGDYHFGWKLDSSAEAVRIRITYRPTQPGEAIGLWEAWTADDLRDCPDHAPARVTLHGTSK